MMEYQYLVLFGLWIRNGFNLFVNVINLYSPWNWCFLLRIIEQIVKISGMLLYSILNNFSRPPEVE